MITILKKNESHIQLVKFILVGIANTALGYGLFALFLYINIFYLISLTISHIIATTNSYILNKYITFNSKGEIRKEAWKFFLVYGMIYIINFTFLFIAVRLLRFKPLIAQIFILIIVTAISFLGQKYFTFKKEKL